MAEYIRLGQDSILLTKTATDKDLETYSDTFLRLMNTAYPQMKRCGNINFNGLTAQAFSFVEKANIERPKSDDWLKSLCDSVFKQQGDTQSFTVNRILRVYDEDIIIFIKQDKLRYWIRSIAIRDVDDVISDIMQGSN